MPVRRSHWALLGIAPTSDTREIKRAYARLLKQTRPDDDPEGFQRLREALEAALAQAPWVKVSPAPTGPLDLVVEPVVVEPAAAEPVEPSTRPGDEQSAPPADPWADLKPQLLQANHTGRVADAIALLDAALAQASGEGRRVLSDWLLAYCATDAQVPALFLRAALQRFGWLEELPPAAGERQRALSRLAHRHSQLEAQDLLAPIITLLQKGREDEAIQTFRQALQSPRLHALDAREYFECLLMRQLARGDGWYRDFVETVFRTCRWEQEHQHLRQFDQRAWQALLTRREGEEWYAGLLEVSRQTPVRLALSPKETAASLFLPPGSWCLRWHMLSEMRQQRSRHMVALIDRRYGWLAQRFPADTLALLRQPHAHLGRYPGAQLLILGLFVLLLLTSLNTALTTPFEGLVVLAAAGLLWAGLCAAIVRWLPERAELGYRLAMGLILGLLASTLSLLSLVAVSTSPGPRPPLWQIPLPALGTTALVAAFAAFQRRWRQGWRERYHALDERLSQRLMPQRLRSYRVIGHSLFSVIVGAPSGMALVLLVNQSPDVVEMPLWAGAVAGFLIMQMWFLLSHALRPPGAQRPRKAQRKVRFIGNWWWIWFAFVLLSQFFRH